MKTTPPPKVVTLYSLQQQKQQASQSVSFSTANPPAYLKKVPLTRELKVCPECNTELPLYEFYADQGRHQDVDAYCKGCRSIKQAYYRHKQRFNTAKSFWQTIFASKFYIHCQRPIYSKNPHFFYNFLLQINESSRIYYMMAFNYVFHTQELSSIQSKLDFTLENQLNLIKEQYPHLNTEFTKTDVLATPFDRKKIYTEVNLFKPDTKSNLRPEPIQIHNFTMNGPSFTEHRKTIRKNISWHTVFQFCNVCGRYLQTYSKFIRLKGLRLEDRSEDYSVDIADTHYTDPEAQWMEIRNNFNNLIALKAKKSKIVLVPLNFKRSTVHESKWKKRCIECSEKTTAKSPLTTELPTNVYFDAEKQKMINKEYEEAYHKRKEEEAEDLKILGYDNPETWRDESDEKFREFGKS